jgi:hypothetical protein
VICPLLARVYGFRSCVIGIAHSQPFTNWIFHFLIIVGSAVSHVTHQFYKIRYCTRVALAFVLDVLDRPMPSSWTSIRPLPNYTHRFHTWWLTTLPPHTSNGRDFLREKHVLPQKRRIHHSKNFSYNQVSNLAPTAHQLIPSHWLSSHMLHVIPTTSAATVHYFTY